jgi:hypothetical protein
MQLALQIWRHWMQLSLKYGGTGCNSPARKRFRKQNMEALDAAGSSDMEALDATGVADPLNMEALDATEII